MHKLYIANCTKQNMEFLFRVPEDKKVYHRLVKPGEQVQIYKDAPLDVLMGIVKQHEKYGIVEASAVDRNRNYVGWTYSIDRVVQADKIEATVNTNDDVLNERGQALRLETAVAAAATVEDHARQSNAEVKGVTVEVKEDVPRGASSDNRVDETIHVNRNAPAGKPARNKNRR